MKKAKTLFKSLFTILLTISLLIPIQKLNVINLQVYNNGYEIGITTYGDVDEYPLIKGNN